jgi:hypothetical protein
MVLKELFSQYEENICDLINLCKGRTLAFDFDGTLTRFQYTKERMLPCSDEDIEEYTKLGGNIYKNIYVLKTMKYVMSQLNKDDVFIVTSTVPSLRETKNKLIFEHFNIPCEHVIHTNGALKKIDALVDLYAKTGKDILFVEDNYKILLTAEENLNFVKSYHISSLLA